MLHDDVFLFEHRHLTAGLVCSTHHIAAARHVLQSFSGARQGNAQRAPVDILKANYSVIITNNLRMPRAVE